MKPTSTPRSRPVCRAGFSIVEATLCTVLVAILFGAAVQAVGLSGTVQFKAAGRAQGRALAWALLDEIVQQKYSAAGAAPTTPFDLILGPPAVAVRAGDRTGFDDLDDYRDYSDAPPVHRDGSAIAGAGPYVRRVTVSNVNPLDLSQVTAGETGIKRVTVVVTRNGQTVARASALRCDVP